MSKTSVYTEFKVILLAVALCAVLFVSLGSSAYGGPLSDTTEAPVVETPPVSHSGDAADDSAIWRDAANPSRSVLIETDKGGSLLVRDLNTGGLLQRIDRPLFNNVDLREGFLLGGSRKPLVVASRQDSKLPAVYALDTSTRKLSNVSNGFSTTLPNEYGTSCTA